MDHTVYPNFSRHPYPSRIRLLILRVIQITMITSGTGPTTHVAWRRWSWVDPDARASSKRSSDRATRFSPWTIRTKEALAAYLQELLSPDPNTRGASRSPRTSSSTQRPLQAGNSWRQLPRPSTNGRRSHCSTNSRSPTTSNQRSSRSRTTRRRPRQEDRGDRPRWPRFRKDPRRNDLAHATRSTSQAGSCSTTTRSYGPMNGARPTTSDWRRSTLVAESRSSTSRDSSGVAARNCSMSRCSDCSGSSTDHRFPGLN